MTYIAKVSDVTAVPADRDGLTGSERAVSSEQAKGSKYVDASQYELYRSIVGSGGRGHAPLLAFGQALPKACPPGEDCEESIDQIFEELDLLEKPDTERPVHEMGVTPLDANPHEKPMSDVNTKIAELVKKLGDEDGDVRKAAIEELAEIGQPAIPALIKALEGDEDWSVQVGAAAALVKIGSVTEEVIPPLIKVLEEGENEYGRASAALALGEIGASEAIPALVKAFVGGPSDMVRQAVAEALNKIKGVKKAYVYP